MEFDTTFDVGCGKNKAGEKVFQAWMTVGYIGGSPSQQLVFSGNKIGFAHWFASLVEDAELAENAVTVGLSNYSQ